MQLTFHALKLQLIPQNKILDNRNLTLKESTNFLGTHLDTNLSWALHGKNIEETEYSMQFYEEFISLYDTKLINL